jgi:ubiquinone/menaquinone biosynthesis C-methylase UbiE
MRRLTGSPELLDGSELDPVTLAGNLRDLRRVNRLLGGVALSSAALDVLAGQAQEPVRLVDVGTGGADIPLALMAAWRRRGRRLCVTGVEDRRAILDAALAARPAVGRVRDLALVIADGRVLPFPDGSFDVAHASLVLHHLEPPDAVTLLAEMGRVARRGVIVNDVLRSPLAWLAAVALSHLATMNRYTRNDAPLSVRRAYQPDEARELLAHAGLRPVFERRRRIGWRWVIAAVRA